MNINSFKKKFVGSIFISLIYTQVYIPADPFNILFLEQKAIKDNGNFGSLSLRPTFNGNSSDTNMVSIKYRSELFFNSNAPN